MATLFEFKECRNCHCKETVAKKACEKEPTLSKGSFVALQSTFTPIQDISKITTPMVRGIMSHYDACAECGFLRVVRVDEASIPASMLSFATGMPKRK